MQHDYELKNNYDWPNQYAFTLFIVFKILLFVKKIFLNIMKTVIRTFKFSLALVLYFCNTRRRNYFYLEN